VYPHQLVYHISLYSNVFLSVFPKCQKPTSIFPQVPKAVNITMKPKPRTTTLSRVFPSGLMLASSL